MTIVGKDLTFKATIEELNNRGEGIVHVQTLRKNGKYRNTELAIPYTLPGEEVLAKQTMPFRKKKAQMEERYTSHPERITPECEHFGLCGGCSWQHWTYEAQLQQKTAQVKSYMVNNGHDPDVVQPTIGAVKEWNYRNKMEFTFSPSGELGLHEKDNYRHVIPLKECLIASSTMVDVSMTVATWAKKHQITGYDKGTHTGILRNLMVRHSQATNEVMLALFATVAPEEVPVHQELVDTIVSNHPEVKSLMWLENREVADRVQSEKTHVLSGRDYIYDELAGFRFRLWFDTFFQTNPEQAQVLVDLALELAQARPDERMIDLFCGVGTFSLPFAKEVKELYGVEIVESSIASAKRNAVDNEITNALFFAQDARRGLAEVVETYGTPDLLLVDPPRSGAGGKVMRRIGRTEAKRVVYISCNPETFAEDIVHLQAFGYRLEVVQPVDLFPQTYHCEIVALLSRVDE